MNTTAAPETMLNADEPMDKIVFYAFDEARQKLEQGHDVEPFTVVLAGDDLYIESHPGEDIVECFNSARKTISDMSLLADGYVFCYDGYVQMDEGPRDGLIAERAEKDDEVGEAFVLFYRMDEGEEGSIEFEDTIFGLGEAPSLFGADEFDDEQLEGFDDEMPEGDEDTYDPDEQEDSEYLDEYDEAEMEFMDMAMSDDLEQAANHILND